MTVSAAQIRAARALLDWTQAQLATATLLDVSTVRRAEVGKKVTKAALAAIRQVLEAEGVVFVMSAADVAGVDEPMGVLLKPGRPLPER